MNLKPGQIVRFLNDVGGGTIRRVTDKYAYVMTDDGFELPVLHKEIVVIEEPAKEEKKIIQKPDFDGSYNYIEREENDYPDPVVQGNNSSGNDDDPEIVFALCPADSRGTDGDLQTFLINNGNWYLHYVAGISEDNEHALLDHGILEPGTRVHLGNVKAASVTNISGFSIQVMRFRHGHFELQKMTEKIIRLKPHKMFASGFFSENDYFDQPAWLVPVDRDETENTVRMMHPFHETYFKKEEAEPDKSKMAKKREAPQIIEVDLHIQELLDDYRNMSNTEMLEFQMSVFRSELEKAIVEKAGRIVFIHGVGNGVLKLKLRKELQDVYPHLRFQDASFAEYGYGATMVIVRKNG